MIERKKKRYSLVCFVIIVVTVMSPFPFSTQMCVPKFSISVTYDLGSTLQKMGMREAFAESADLTWNYERQWSKTFLCKLMNFFFSQETINSPTLFSQ